MTQRDAAWNELVEHIKRIETLDSVMSTLGWDEQTMMPPKAASLRGAQQAVLAKITHELAIDPRIEKWLGAIEGDPDPVRAACYRNLKREYDRTKCVPTELIERLAVARSEAFAAWLEAKRTSRFAGFAPKLAELVELSRRRAEAIDPHRHPYDVMLEGYDPGTTTATLREMFGRLRKGLLPLLDAIAARPQLPRLDGEFNLEKQEELHREIAVALGYDFEGGRLDYAEHPFSSGHGPGDVRITTKLNRRDLLAGLSGTIHEVGHALYEQGRPHELDGTTCSQPASFGLHESQSRFWENAIGRSPAFAKWMSPLVERLFPGVTVDPDALYAAQNRVERGLIRVQADEITYNLHVIVRFEIELMLLEGTVAVKDLPELWNAKYREYLGVAPPDDARGVLQDVHWSSASFGYFPSYTLGNLYAASLAARLEEVLPDLWSNVEHGRFEPILAFLRKNVHSHGHLQEAPEIVKGAVGERDHVEDLLAHLWRRHGALYGVKRA